LDERGLYRSIYFQILGAVLRMVVLAPPGGSGDMTVFDTMITALVEHPELDERTKAAFKQAFADFHKARTEAARARTETYRIRGELMRELERFAETPAVHPAPRGLAEVLLDMVRQMLAVPSEYEADPSPDHFLSGTGVHQTGESLDVKS